MSCSRNNQGAINALKGYRKQFIYTLQRILCYNEIETEFRPEGEYEDLDIYGNDGGVVEIIQVKALLSKKLSLKDILESKTENSFLQRTIRAFSNNHSPTIKLVSFGEVNDDIQQLSQGNYSPALIAKLKELKLKDADIRLLQNHFKCEVVEEKRVEENIKRVIEGWGNFIDSSITIELLVYWIYSAAEKQVIVNINEFKQQVEKIGQFQIGRLNFNEQYGTIIRPLNYNIEKDDLQILKSDFYQGISASFKHILADIDVKRFDKLLAINNKFQKCKVVFIHGASGQGKSTLAYRYLAEYCNENTVFEIKLSNDILKIYKTINALESIAQGIRFPITLYIDIVPCSSEWINLIFELASKIDFKFLVTIRSEDWNATQIKLGDKFQFDELELTLEKDEAEQIYNSLNTVNPDLKYIDFEDAWRNFGEHGPLLEFVYLITQNESLSAKLKSQIFTIWNDQTNIGNQKIKLLRYIALADSFSSKVRYKELSRFLNIDNLGFLVELLQKEYLIKLTDDKAYITGLHPVRSEIIKDILFDNEVHIVSEYVLDSLNFIADNTLFNFLRFAFRQASLSPDVLLEKLKKLNPNSWQFYYWATKSFIWKGIDDYVNQNINTLNKIYNDYQKGWLIVVNFDFSGITERGSFMESSDLFSEEQRKYAKDLNSKLSPKENVYKHCKEWLQSIKQIELGAHDNDEWQAFSLFLFWLHYFEIKDIKINFNNLDFDKYLHELSLEVLSYVLYSIKCQKKIFSEFVTKVETSFLQKLSKEFSIIEIEKENNSINCHYLVDIIDEKFTTDETDFVHAKSMRIINLIRYAFPEMESFGTNGVGYKFSFLPDMPDSSYKRIPKKNLPLKQLVEINSTFINIFEYTKRLSGWQEYVDSIITKRKLYVDILNKLVYAFCMYHKQKNLQPLVQYVQDYSDNYHSKIKNEPMSSLPKSIIDEWGLIGERVIEDAYKAENYEKSLQDITQVLAQKKYEKYLTLLRDYDSSIENFLWQSADTIVRKIKILLKEDASEIQDSARVSLVGNLYKTYECIMSFQQYFEEHFKKFTDIKLLQSVEKQEIEAITTLCFVYHHFINSETFLLGNIPAAALNRFNETKNTFKRKLIDSFKILGKKTASDITLDFDENNKRCIVIANTPNALSSLELIQKVYDNIYSVLGQPDYSSIKYLLVNSLFPDFNLILLVHGKPINMKWYEFKIYNLREKEYADLSQFNLIPQDMPEYFVKKFSLQAWNKSLNDFQALDQLLESISTCNQLAFHFHQLKYFENKSIEDYNLEIFTNHVKKTGSLFQENLQKALDLYANYAELCNTEQIDFLDDSEKLDFYNLLINNHKNFYPTDELFELGEMKFTLGAEEIKNWLPRLEELTNNTSLMYYFLAGKIIGNKFNT
ncbi:MAG: hypothetical protein AB7S48_17150 [Bacteroidales bacterium]